MLFAKNVTRIGHAKTRRLLLHDDDPARPANEETFEDRRTLEIGGEQIDQRLHLAELARSGRPNGTYVSQRDDTRRRAQPRSIEQELLGHGEGNVRWPDLGMTTTSPGLRSP